MRVREWGEERGGRVGMGSRAVRAVYGFSTRAMRDPVCCGMVSLEIMRAAGCENPRMVVGEAVFEDGSRDCRVWAVDDEGSVVDVGGLDRRAQPVLFGVGMSIADELKREIETYVHCKRVECVGKKEDGDSSMIALRSFVDDPLLFLNKVPRVKKTIERIIRICRFAMETRHDWLPTDDVLDLDEFFDA